MYLIFSHLDKPIQIDEVDLTLVSLFHWRDREGGYLSATVARSKNKRKWTTHIRLHRLILGLPTMIKPRLEIDHINGDKYDNRNNNLRFVSSSQNKFNKPKQSTNTSGYKGVSYDTVRKCWMAQLSVGGKCLLKKRFKNIKDAARAYNEAALKYHGEFAYLNVIED